MIQNNLAESDRAARIATSEKLAYLAEARMHCSRQGKLHAGLHLKPIVESEAIIDARTKCPRRHDRGCKARVTIDRVDKPGVKRVVGVCIDLQAMEGPAEAFIQCSKIPDRYAFKQLIPRIVAATI